MTWGEQEWETLPSHAWRVKGRISYLTPSSVGEAEERAVQCMPRPLLEGGRQPSKEEARGTNSSPYSLLTPGSSFYPAKDSHWLNPTESQRTRVPLLKTVRHTEFSHSLVLGTQGLRLNLVGWQHSALKQLLYKWVTSSAGPKEGLSTQFTKWENLGRNHTNHPVSAWTLPETSRARNISLPQSGYGMAPMAQHLPLHTRNQNVYVRNLPIKKKKKKMAIN